MAERRSRRALRILVRVRAGLRGVGEVLAFLGAGARAIGLICLGRWPELRPRKYAATPTQADLPLEELGPDPVD